MDSFTIGLLHSQSGTMSFSETPLLEAELLAIDEINQSGGILGKRIDPVIENGASDPFIFAEKAQKLIKKDHVTTIFGGWNSHTRKAVKWVVEKYNALFWYPMQYEGLEESPNIFYTGSCLNQQIQPALDWCWDQGWRNFLLLGSDYIYPITANKLMKSILKYRGGNVVDEIYIPLGHTDFTNVIKNICHAKPHVIINTLNGDSNTSFFNEYRLNFSHAPFPVLSTSVAEHECLQIGEAAVGHYSCWNYFQCLDTPENRLFVENFRKQYGSDRVISDPIVMAYSQIFMWKQLVESVSSFDVTKILDNAEGQEFFTPLGQMKMMANNHVTKPQTFIGKSVKPGEFKIVGKNKDYSRPLPWFGIEESSLPSYHLVKDIMKAFPDTINFTVKLEQQVKERTKDLSNSEHRLRDVFETMMEGIVIISNDGIITQANAEAERILGLKRSELVNRNYISPEWNIIRPDGKPMHNLEMAGPRAFIEMRPVRDVAMGIVHNDKSVTWMNVCATPIFNNEGMIDGVVCTFSDITQSKKMWEELQKTQRLESLGVLAGGIAHDFNNLLSGIFGNIDLAIDSAEDNETVLSYLDKAMKAFERVKDLTQQLLTFAKGGHPVKTNIAVEPLINESLSLSLSGSTVVPEVYIEPLISELDADPNQLSQVLNNIFLNARQAMPKGGKLSISIRRYDSSEKSINELQDGQYIEIAIHDEGVGIPKQQLSQIFDPFFTTKKEGNGLGLSMCHSIIKKHKGAILVDSVEGEGTTFQIFLPVSTSKQTPVFT